MKGIVFNLLSELVRREFGEDTWDDLVDAAGVSGAYTSLGSYDDGEMFKLVGAASTALGKPPADILRWFGRGAMPMLAHKYPGFFDSTGSTRPFLLALNNIIHPEVRKLYPGADVPVFDFDDSRDETLVMGYHSARRLCALAEGFVLGAADHFSEAVTVEQSQCMHRGDDKCVFQIAFAPRHATAVS